MSEWKSELAALFSKIYVWLGLIFVGMIGVISNNLFTSRRLTIGQIIGSLGLAFFVGVLVSVVCSTYEWDRAGAILVPTATLLSEKIVNALMSVNWEKSFKEGFKEWLKSRLK